MKILIVDDNETNTYMLEALFRGIKYECVTAKNGEDALQQLASNPVDLILSDTLMPVMDGFQFCHKVKTDVRFSHIPFVFYSGTYRDREDVELAHKLGAAKYLTKPMEPAELLREIQDIMKAVAEGTQGRPQPSMAEEADIYRLYSERLVNKLEKKTSELEWEVADRKQIEADLIVSLHCLKKVICEKNQGMETLVKSIKADVDAIRKISSDKALASHLDHIEKEIEKSAQTITVKE